MASTAAPYGLRPINRQGGTPSAGGNTRMFTMTTNLAAPLYAGMVALLNASGEIIQPPTGGPVVGTTTSRPIGVIAGFRFVDPVLKYELYDTVLPTGAVNAGYTNIRIYVYDDPDQLYMVQSSGSVARASIGRNFAMLNAETGSTISKRSNSSITATALTTTAASCLRLVDFVESVFSTAGDSFTDCIVKFQPGIHAYDNATPPA